MNDKGRRVALLHAIGWERNWTYKLPVERAVVLGSSEFILAEDLPETLLEDVSPAALGNA
jgi:hypothetical protein